MTTVTNRNGIEFDIDAIATDLNNKVDLDGTNATYPHVVSRTPNSQGGVVEIWSDGYCVQTGKWTGSISATKDNNTYTEITLDQSYKDTNFQIFVDGNELWIMEATVPSAVNKFQYNFGAYANSRTVSRIYWRTEGYIR